MKALAWIRNPTNAEHKAIVPNASWYDYIAKVGRRGAICIHKAEGMVGINSYIVTLRTPTTTIIKSVIPCADDERVCDMAVESLIDRLDQEINKYIRARDALKQYCRAYDNEQEEK